MRPLLIACEKSGVVRRAFRDRGFDAWSCDLEAAEDSSPFHIQCDALEVAYRRGAWGGMICHPECRYLCGSGTHWLKRRPGRFELMEEAADFAIRLWNAPIPKLCMENSVGVLSKWLRKPDQIIQPYNFGADASKATALWLLGLPLLKATEHVPGRCVGEGRDGRPVYRWANQTNGGQNKLPPSADRSAKRAETYPGVAAAMADQWGALLSADR